MLSLEVIVRVVFDSPGFEICAREEVEYAALCIVGVYLYFFAVVQCHTNPITSHTAIG